MGYVLLLLPSLQFVSLASDLNSTSLPLSLALSVSTGTYAAGELLTICYPWHSGAPASCTAWRAIANRTERCAERTC
uniref:Putative secreted protein n=1 Tax=Anopheles triannulatus TaxID=58253 RepID=A0A2M4B1J1_9DIPT